MSNWPEGVHKPELPPGYEWGDLQQYLGIGESPNHPWSVSVIWTGADNKKRFVRSLCFEKFDTPYEARNAAVKAANEHHARKATP